MDRSDVHGDEDRWKRSSSVLRAQGALVASATANPPTNILDFRGFDSSIMLFFRGGILMSIGNSPESLSQVILVGCNVSREIGSTSVGASCVQKGG